jgi:hypothetical protein
VEPPSVPSSFDPFLACEAANGERERLQARCRDRHIALHTLPVPALTHQLHRFPDLVPDLIPPVQDREPQLLLFNLFGRVERVRGDISGLTTAFQQLAPFSQ